MKTIGKRTCAFLCRTANAMRTAAFVIVGFNCILIWQKPGAAQTVAPTSVDFHFGPTSLKIERAYLKEQPSPRKLNQDEWKSVTAFEMARNQIVSIYIKDALANSVACRDMLKAVVIERSPQRPALVVPAYKGWHPVPTSNPKITSFVNPSPHGDGAVFYEFDDPELLDIFGSKLGFVRHENATDPMPVVVGAKLAPEMSVRVAAQYDNCFMTRGDELPREILRFLRRRMNQK